MTPRPLHFCSGCGATVAGGDKLELHIKKEPRCPHFSPTLEGTFGFLKANQDPVAWEWQWVNWPQFFNGIEDELVPVINFLPNRRRLDRGDLNLMSDMTLSTQHTRRSGTNNCFMALKGTPEHH